MTRAWCVRTDAVQAVRVGALLTVLACAGCAGSRTAPAVTQPPPEGAPGARTPGVGRGPGRAMLRVGLPAARRANLLFTCDAPPALPRIGSATYARDSLDRSGRLWLRLPGDAGDSAGALAPDSLIVRAFDDATDEEIALERGELDVAVFWPGEPSARMRSDARYRDPELGLRSRGVLACVAGAGDTLGPPRADMELLDREAFGGDLLPWSELEPGPGEGPPARYVVDPTVPGAKHLERILARAVTPGAARTLKLVYLDQPVTAADAAAAWRMPGLTPLFALRCPVLAGPEVRDDVRAIGAGAFAELAPCAGGTRR